MFPSSSSAAANSHSSGYFVEPLPFFSDVTTNFSSFSIPSSPFYLYHDPDPFQQPLIDDVVARDQPSQEDKKPKKKKKKMDRHSKINTAQGLRDRRMRLSLEVARKFFDLQDMLEFDKASKTVEWLLNQSYSAIKELSTNREGIISSSPCSSECDVVSGVFDEFVDSSAPIDDGSDKGPAKKEKKLIVRTRQKSRGIVARESRKQARARARERTMEKIWIRKLISSDDLISNSNPAAAASEEESGSNNKNYSYMKPSNMEEVAQLDEAKELGLLEEQMIGGNSYSFTGTYGIISQEEYPLRDFQMLIPKQWEACSNPTHLC